MKLLQAPTHIDVDVAHEGNKRLFFSRFNELRLAKNHQSEKKIFI